MKKVLLLLSSVALLATANAQEEAAESTSSSSSFKQEAGDKTLEFQFQSPFASGSPFSLNAGELRFRSFKSETFALRAGFHYSYNTSEDNFVKILETDSDGNVTGVKESYADATRNVAFNFRPGFEMHFDGTDKLSPYVGVIGSIGYDKKTVIDREAVDGDKNKTADPKEVSEVLKQKTRTGNFNFGLSGVAGFDYYFTKKLYIGGEMGFGFSASRPFSAKVSGDFTGDDGNAFPGKEQKATKGGITTITLAPSFVGAFRLGFAF